MSYNPYSLIGKTILITGASSGIGKATAIETAKLGASLIITGRDNARLIETLGELDGEGHLSFACDISIEAERHALVDFCPALDGVAHIAGVSDTTLGEFATEKKVVSHLQINLIAPIALQQRLLKKKKIRPHASIVFMASAGAHKVNIGYGIYSAAKAGLIQFAKTLAKELGSKQIRVNTVSPAMVETPLIMDSAISSEQYEEDKKKYALKRYGQPREVALMVTYLLSDAASWLTGCDYILDGGYLTS